MTLKHYCPLMSIGAIAAESKCLIDCLGSSCEMWVSSISFEQEDFGRCGLIAVPRFAFHPDPAAQEDDDDA